MKTHLGVALAFMLLVAPTPPPPVSADPAPDYDTDTGHFYTQANGHPPGQSVAGFEISDEDGIPFWREFRWRGGVEVLGYPISRRFEWDGLVCQATQRAILQWEPARQQVQLVNALDVLSAQGRDNWLAEHRQVPRPLDTTAERGLTADQVAARRQGFLNANGAIKAAYYAAPEPVALFGLPTSEVVDLGPVYALRTQRTALYQGKAELSWIKPGQVVVANAGAMVKEAGLLPAAAVVPEPPPPPRRLSASSRGEGRDLGAVEGVATWYGADFHGRLMSNREPYNMYNPTTAASNTYPLGTLLKVTNTSTGAYVIVRVTDRGAFRYPIVVDLSYAAFGRLGNPDRGTVPVRVEPVR